MATKRYLRATQANSHPTSGEKSTTEPVAAQTFGLTPTDRDLLVAKGASATTQVTACVSTTSAQNGCLGRWSSVPLVAGTYGSGTWTLAIQSIESNAGADAKFVLASIYFWRPSNNTVVGFVSDSNTQVGVEFGNNTTARYGQVLSITGSNVTISDGDILVIEVWTGFTQAMATAANLTVCYDGTTDVTAAYAGTDPASFLTAPANIPEIVTTGGTIAGHGVLAGSGFKSVATGGTVAGHGVLAGAGVRTRFGAGTLAGSGVLAGAGVRTRSTGGTVAGSGVLSGSGTHTAVGAGTLAGHGTLSGVGVRTRFADASLAGAGMLSGAGTRSTATGGTLAGHGTLSGAGVRTAFDDGTLDGHGALSGAGTRSTATTGTIAGHGVLSGSGEVLGQVEGTGSLEGHGVLSGTGHVDAATGGHVGGGPVRGHLRARVRNTITADGSLEGHGALRGDGHRATSADGRCSGRGMLRGGGVRVLEASGRVAVTASLDGEGRRIPIADDELVFAVALLR